MAGEPYHNNYFRNKTTFFNANIINPVDTKSSKPRDMSVSFKGGESFTDTIDKKTLSSLENVEGALFVVKNRDRGESARVIIDAGSSGDQEVIRTTGSVEMLETGLIHENLKCSIVLRVYNYF